MAGSIYARQALPIPEFQPACIYMLYGAWNRIASASCALLICVSFAVSFGLSRMCREIFPTTPTPRCETLPAASQRKRTPCYGGHKFCCTRARALAYAKHFDTVAQNTGEYVYVLICRREILSVTPYTHSHLTHDDRCELANGTIHRIAFFHPISRNNSTSASISTCE